MKASGFFRGVWTWFCELIHLTKKESKPSSARLASNTSAAGYRPVDEDRVYVHRGVRW